MRLEHKFVVPAPIEQTWAAFNDLERVVPCFPGATLTSYDGNEFTGSVKVKLGPISLQYTGNGAFAERDPADHHAVIEAKGKDRRGNGTAIAKVTTYLTASGPTSTEVTVATDLTITGRPAQFGRGLIQEVSNKLLDDFIACLVTKLEAPVEAAPSTGLAASVAAAPAAEPTSPAAQAGPAPSADAATSPEGTTSAGGAVSVGGAASAAGATSPDRPPSPADTSTASRTSTEPETETVAEVSLNLGTTLLPVLARRARPYIIGAIVALILRRLLRR
ncbi:SRPBCC family protein [Kribbella sp. NBC_01510]|uniref:SRPBCC family protein n=1 Tax=Kribbella sp. NBC_01510 TaxID=2903581 RepID=UPI0038634E54